LAVANSTQIRLKATIYSSELPPIAVERELSLQVESRVQQFESILRAYSLESDAG